MADVVKHLTRAEFRDLLAAADIEFRVPRQPIRYLSRPEVAARIGVKPDTLNRYLLPPPDAQVGQQFGWSPETIDAWHAARPGRGRAAIVRARG